MGDHIIKFSNFVKTNTMKFLIELTWSKLTAWLVLILAFVIDLHFDKGGQVFMFALPFAAFLITGKQGIDAIRKK